MNARVTKARPGGSATSQLPADALLVFTVPRGMLELGFSSLLTQRLLAINVPCVTDRMVCLSHSGRLGQEWGEEYWTLTKLPSQGPRVAADMYGGNVKGFSVHVPVSSHTGWKSHQS